MEVKGPLFLTPVDSSHSTLRIEPHAQEWSVPGVVLEHWHKHKDGRYLLFTTDNCPYEEALHVMVISIGQKAFELINISQPYTPGMLDEVAHIDDGCIEFSFIGKVRFRATVCKSPTRKLSTFLSPSFIQYAAPLAKKSLHICQL